MVNLCRVGTRQPRQVFVVNGGRAVYDNSLVYDSAHRAEISDYAVGFIQIEH
jgi:hypothetical protein